MDNTIIMAASQGGIISSMTDWLVSLMSQMGGIGVAVAVFLENLFPPIPSEVILPLAGVTASQGKMGLVEAIVWATAGSLIGALVLYAIAAAIGSQRIRRLFDIMPLVQASDIDTADSWFARYGWSSVLIGRVIPVVRSLISIPAGLARMGLARFIGLTVLGSAVWNTVLVMAGFALGQRWQVILSFLDRFQSVVIVLLAALIVWYLVVSVRRALLARDTQS
ncbi:MAG: DedA family protein [Bifidobacterium thermacidophilum]|jgi:membrane protein DedA with SNARE-associated domain|uniref:DedA family protein n=1 Tax=Bifidobacterium thermacidophilum TaxID=246618 RepID=UPI002F35071D